MATPTTTPGSGPARSRTLGRVARAALAERRRRAGYGLEWLASWLMYNNAGFWRIVRAIPVINSYVNRKMIDWLATRAPNRPTPLSLWGPNTGTCADYPSWSSLSDRTFTGRHLPPRPSNDPALPPETAVAEFFKRYGTTSPCPKSTALFCFFAQWFTDSFLRTDATDVRKNTSNHEIDLCQIYGLNPTDTAILRAPDGSGKLRSQRINGDEYPCWLFGPNGLQVQAQFRRLSYINDAGTDYRNQVLTGAFDTPERRSRLFAAGLERGNSTIFYSAINTVFLREHNQLCDILHTRYPLWDGNRLFETARNINIVQLIKVIVEDYINHISPAKFRIFFERGFADSKSWYRTNRIAAEFNLLYRWHSLVPTTFRLGNQPLPDTDFRFNDKSLVEKFGLEAVLTAASTQSAGRISLKNTPAFLWDAEFKTLQKSRSWLLRSFNDYRDRFQLPRLGSFKELVGDDRLAAELEKTYANVDNVELMVGLLAEKRHVDDALFGNLMTYMVGVDAFTQALTNPLLSTNLFNEATFSREGLARINSTSTFAQIVERNVRSSKVTVRFTIAADNPPREMRLPLLGKVQDMIGLLRMFISWAKYFERARQKHGSDVFGVNLYQPTLAVLNHQAMSPLFDSPDFVQDYGFSWAKPPRALVGTVPSIFETGLDHDGPKAFYLELLANKHATLKATVELVANEFINKWLAEPGTVCLRDELERFAATFLARWFFGADFPPDKLRLLYSNLFNHVFPAVTDRFRGHIYAKSLAIRRDWIDFIRGCAEFNKTLVPMAARHGLHSEEAVADQLAFLVGMNGFLGSQNLLKSLVAELALHPMWRDKCRAGEILPGSMPSIDLVLCETLRLHPPVTFIFGRALHSRPLETLETTYRVRGNELVMGVLPFALRDAKFFAEPNTFRPERFRDPSLIKHLIWARSAGDEGPTQTNRACAGKEMGLVIARTFVLRLIERVNWTFTSPPEWDSKRFTLNVAAPVGDLEVRFARMPAIT